MITWLVLWSVAAAAPETITLDNGVQLVVDANADGSGLVNVGWFSGVGTAHTAPGATATALLSLHLGTTSVPSDTVVSTWVDVLGDVPDMHVCALDAGSSMTVGRDGLAAWAWLASDSLADPTNDDVSRPHSLALQRFGTESPADRVPSPWSWPAVIPNHPVTLDLMHRQHARLADPQHLVVVVQGDTTTEQVQAALGPSFARLVPSDTATAAVTSAPRVQHTTTSSPGEPLVVIRADTAPSVASRSLAAALNDRVRSALDRDVFDASVHLDETGDVWTLELRAVPSVGQASRVEAAWLAWLQTIAGEGLAPRPAPLSATDLTALAHGALRPVPQTSGDVQSALTDLLAAPRTVTLTTSPPDDAELARIREQHGELTAELVRIRLQTVAQTPQRDLPGLLVRLRAEREAVAPRLRPALDLVIARAEARQ